MTATDDRTVNRNDIEQALWRWSEWRADQRGVDEILRLVDRYAVRDQTADDVLACARYEADQIVQSAHDEAESVRDTMRRVSMAHVLADAYKDADGVVWVRLGLPEGEPDVLMNGTRKCTQCGGVKDLTRFRKDKASRGGRRAQCNDCANAARRALEAEKRKK